ncbi:MAG TPA: hypothetical protein VFH02_12535 [Jiangellaceae bacterium]|nr:hypothetical protein [Jiangellaceae bacterium]
MSTDDSRFDDVPENLVRLPSRDPVLPERLLAGILCGRPVRAGAAPEALALAELVSALRPPALSHELRGEAAAIAAFRREMSTHGWEEPESRPSRSSVGAKIAALVLASSAGMGGVAAAAADGSLPDPLQDLAHALFGAPPAHPDSDDGKDDLGGTAPFPMPTDASTRSPSPGEPSATSPTAAPTPEQCTPELALPESCEVVADAEPEVGDVLEPGPTPTSTPELDVTDSDSTDTAPTTPSPYETPEPSSTGHPTGPPSWVPVPTWPPGWSSSSGHATVR